MNTALEHLSKEQLIALFGERDRVIREKEAYESQLLALIEKFKRMAFAQKHARRQGRNSGRLLGKRSNISGKRKPLPIKAGQRFPTTFPWKKWRSIPTVTFPVWYASARK